MKPDGRFYATCAFTVLFALTTTLIPMQVGGSVCTEGTGIPPFLSEGTDPNLLLILDNSGSMLDLAYVENVNECVDNSYDFATTYTGLFESFRWYWWREGVDPWQNGEIYSVDDYVYTEGVFYKAAAVTGNPSSGEEIDFDSEVVWAKVYEIGVWTNGTTYAAGSFVQFEEQLYYTAAGGTANDPDTSDGVYIEDDVVTWTAVESTWLDNTAYSVDDIISDDGMLFRATTADISDGTGVWDDSGVNWVRLDEGHFEMVDATNIVDVMASIGAATGDEYNSAGLYLQIESVGGVQSHVPVFIASGNLLNWASASKFDIQKKILTGGKYDANEQHLVSQGRGCSSSGFVKEVSVTDSGGVDSVVTFSIEGPGPDNWIDSTDFTTRISILGVTADGFADSPRAVACQTAIEEIAKGADGSLGTISTNIDVCLAYSGANNVLAESNAAYNHSVFTCWKIVGSGYTVPSETGNVSEITNACEGIYAEVNPPSIDTENSGYPCYGVYNQATPDARIPTGTGSDREGYIGRCWEPGSFPAGCEAVPCAGGQPVGTGNPRCYPDGFQYECSGNYNVPQDTCNKPWVMIVQDTADLADVACPAGSTAAPGGWTDDLNPNTGEECVQEAIWDYCKGLGIPEVIDPSDLVFNTTETWGLVGALVDSGVMSMFGVNRPLLVMKGYIAQTTAPEGILHDVAGDLRLGVMAFNENGADTECAAADPTDAIVQYCPGTNKDGAKLIAPIKSGVEVTDDKGTATTADDVTHVDDLTVAVNAVEATAWTPLAEAVYNAVGYYGQNTNYRLHADDFATEAEGGAVDPVQFWCQENNILIITEGASTADVHADVANLVTTIMPGLAVEDSSVAAVDEEECLDSDGNSLLFGSTYLDDVTYFANDGPVTSIYATPAATPGQLLSDAGVLHNKHNINTYVVTTGSLRDDGTTSECNPATIMTNAASNGGTSLLSGANPGQLESNLKAALADILSRVSAGSAASVISSTRSGAGAVYQAIFWPDLTDSGGDTVSWVGDVHALFLNSDGALYEDTPVAGIQDRTLDTSVDQRVLFFFDQSVSPSRTRVCTGALITPEDVNNNGVLDSEDSNCNGILDAGEDLNGNFVLDSEDLNNNCILDYACSGTVREVDAINYIWSVSAPNADGWLTDAVLDPLTQRATFISDDMERYIFTWNDLNNDGIVDSALEQVDFTYTALSGMAAVGTRGSVMEDFAVADAAEWQKVINWIRGQDQIGMRSRLYDTFTWRLGDVIHSTPTLVGRPVEAYHFVYKDSSYALFAKQYSQRRNIVYFGANDGMLHAINAGFYVQRESKFCLTDQREADGTCDTAAEANQPDLGAELWAYVPYNLHPHLKCLTDTGYDHKYYVDQRPRVFDVQIFEDDCVYDAVTGAADCSSAVHPGGWGTILVGSMRFGGAPIQSYVSADPAVTDLTNVATDNRKFISSYFVLDITDPENPPNLLAEMTMTTDVDGSGDSLYAELGYSTVIPAMDVMRDDEGKTDWYLIFGNGPTTVKGENTEQGKVAVLPLSWLNGEVTFWKDPTDDNAILVGPHRLETIDTSTRKAFRIPNMEPNEDPDGNGDVSDAVGGGIFVIPAAVSGDVESFTSDMVSVDFDIEKTAIPGIGAAYKTDAVYFGTSDGTGFFAAFAGCTGLKCWQGGGRLYRLVTKEYDGSNNEIVSEPWDWYLAKMIDAQQPISAAVSVGWDNSNFWIYIGTGRFFDKNDKTDDQTHRMYGLIEPRNCNKQQTWPTINWWVAGTNKAPDPTQAAGDRGLMQVDEILIEEGTGYLLCLDGTENCRKDHTATTITTFNTLRSYIVGETACLQTNTDIGLDGWFREFPDDRERNLGQATLLGGLLTYTTYKPYQDVCKAEGESYLYGVHYQTGTAWTKSVFGTYDFSSTTIVKDRLSLGTGLALTPSLHVGTGDADATAFVQTSTGEILEIAQEELPLGNFKSGRSSWRQE